MYETQDELEGRYERAMSALSNDRSRLLALIETLDTDELYQRLTGESTRDLLSEMDIDDLEALAGTGK